MHNEESDEKEVESTFKELLLAKSEISLIIKDYNDIFSSFDPRPYVERALSDDFLMEAKRAARDKQGIYELRFLVPKAHRNFEHEVLIRKRLHDHFKRHNHLLNGEIRSAKKQGYSMAVLGATLIFIATLLASYTNNFFFKFFEILLEPAGWFTAWTGLDMVFYTIKEKKPDLDFYHKMSEADIRFSSY